LHGTAILARLLPERAVLGKGDIVQGNEQGHVPEPGAMVLRRQFPLLGPYVPPRTPTEQKLAEIWRSALGMDQIGIADSYEDLGGDSLLAAGIFAEIERTFAIEIAMATLVDAPTIQQLAPRIDALVAGRK
jgi:acyl carrier protein